MANFKRAAKRRKYARRQRKRYGAKKGVMSDITILKGKMRDFGRIESKKFDIQRGLWNSATPEADNSMIYQEVDNTGLSGDQLRFVTLLNDMEGGQTYEKRIGRQVINKHITIRGTIFPRRMGSNSTSFATQVQTTCRTILVWDNCPNGRKVFLDEIFVAVTNGTNNTFTSQSMLNLNYRERFEILYDKTHVLGPMTVVGTNTPGSVTYSTGNGSIPLYIHKKLNRVTTYLEESSFVDPELTMIANGALYLITLGNATVNEAVGAWTNGGELTFNSRLRFADP